MAKITVTATALPREDPHYFQNSCYVVIKMKAGTKADTKTVIKKTTIEGQTIEDAAAIGIQVVISKYREDIARRRKNG